MALIFFLFLFFFVFFAIVLLAIQSVTRGSSSDAEIERLMKPSVNAAEVKKHGNVNDINSVISAFKERADNPFYTSSGSVQIGTIAGAVSKLSKELRIVKLEMLVFKMMIGAVSLLMGMIAAFLALTGSISGFFGI